MTVGTAQQRPVPEFEFFLGAAGAVETATRNLPVDLKPLSVNTISLGLVDTEMFQNAPAEIKESSFQSHLDKLFVDHIGTP
ncbi:hypothetical protein FRC12_004976 [Ceratobasidium sp. 428]|nr:hypothetical protein FRC12_004976 [Ceratobasidium sp. 428]